jgi:hypothetical protein
VANQLREDIRFGAFASRHRFQGVGIFGATRSCIAGGKHDPICIELQVRDLSSK